MRRECVYPDTARSEKARPDNDDSLKQLSSRLEEVCNRLSNIEDFLRETKSSRTRTRPSADTSPANQSTSDSCPGLLSIPGYTKDLGQDGTEHSEGDSSTYVNNDVALTDELSLAGTIPSTVLSETVDIYFAYCHNQPYSLFHEANFRQRLSCGEIPPHLLFAIMASAVRFSHNPFFGDRHSMAVFYANQSWKSIVSSCFSATRIEDLQTLQSLTLLSIFDFSGKGRHALAWVKIGLSVRIAQSMRLMMESRNALSHADQEERRRVFWSLYLLDKLVTCGRAQPPAILDASCQLQLPCSEVAWRAGLEQKTLNLQQLFSRTGSNPVAYDAGPFTNVIAMAYTLSRAAQYMLQQFNMQSQEPPWDANSEFAGIQSDLLYLESRLEMHKSPTEVMAGHTVDGEIDQQSAGPAIFSRALFHLCYCLLHHPLLLRRRLESCHIPGPSSFLSRAFDTAWEHSKRLTLLLQEARYSGATTRASFFGYCTVVAGTIVALHRHHWSESKRLESAELLKCNINFLDDLGQFYRNACSIGQSLKRFTADTSAFATLISNSALPEGLTTENFECLWDLVDYSTMSDTAPVFESSPANSHIWHYSDACWDELFGSFDLVDFANQSIQFDVGSLMGDITESSQLPYTF
ncbi:hypothetical protein Z517_00516 [Fonsecaea pedrosoi CBS 271.37]|uniref:Xylanolytic transcriptional activator regulatory domain-containing protein n=1 Tax=Fonsecaea pedrosoi CBS 271.37 TaxID=1442368 RepID=A0A0D2FEQ9_9EURO|nr:uncharacterized protein Z517_00516 [Fonsecaea pedrosoi CBS 271.37]KIW85127.1 hypothetical protein Z517_00516 [Fonsecaea pedrosoi CBS 271.37]